MANDPIAWLVFRVAEEARHASQRNALVVLATSPDEARDIAEARAPGGEKYRAGFKVMSVAAALACDGVSGCITVRGDLASDSQPIFPKDATWVF